MKRETITSHFKLDLRNEVCPHTFIRTKTALDRMSPGQVLEVTVRGMAIENVPRSVMEEGHSIVHVRREQDFFVFFIEKDGGRKSK